MPKIVDHDERREQLASAVLTVIRRSGLSRVTLREVAREVGWTSGVLLHYFRDKDDLLTFAFQLAHQRARESGDARMHGLAGRAALRAYMEATLPLDDMRHLNATIWQAFEGHAASVAELAEQQCAQYEGMHQRVQGLIERAQATGEIAATLEPDCAAADVASTIIGLRTMALINPQHYTPEFMLAVVDEVLDRLAPAGTTAALAGA